MTSKKKIMEFIIIIIIITSTLLLGTIKRSGKKDTLREGGGGGVIGGENKLFPFDARYAVTVVMIMIIMTSRYIHFPSRQYAKSTKHLLANVLGNP